MRIEPDDPRLKELEIDDFVRYLERKGWRLTNHPNDRLFVFEGPKDLEGKPVRLIIPRNKSFEDTYTRLANAINLTAAIRNEEPSAVLENAVKTDKYLMRLENNKIAKLTSSLNMAKEAIKQNELDYAEHIISTNLAEKIKPEFAEEFRNLLEQVYFYRHLELHGTVLSAQEFQMSLSGREVGYGLIPTDAFVGRVKSTQSLIYRTAARKAGRPFEEKEPNNRAMQEDFGLFLTAEHLGKAASFAVTFRIGRLKEQLSLFPVESEQIFDEILYCLELVNNQEEDKLREIITDEAYLRNFVGLAQQLAPDGEAIKLVGFTTKKGDEEHKVAVTRKKEEIQTQLKELIKATQMDEVKDEPVIITGTLLYANSLSSKNVIKIMDRNKKKHAVIVPTGMMRDIVKPLWEFAVTITGLKTKKGIILWTIEKAEGW